MVRGIGVAAIPIALYLPLDEAMRASTTVSAAGQAQGQPPQQPVFRVEANYVRVDVYVTDDGVPVRDLAAEDFELFEDGVRQEIQAFEHVEILGRRTGAPVSREPQTVRESRELAADPRNRVFVVFLDTYHAEVEAGHRVRRALVTLLERVLGPDDLVGVMTPDMAAGELSLGRRTETIAQMLEEHWYWGKRDRATGFDPEETAYEMCYPDADYPGLARELIERRREQRTFGALEELALHLRGLREERKAVIVASDGWRLFRDNRAVLEAANPVPQPLPRPGVGPQGGLTSDVQRARGAVPIDDCRRGALELASYDSEMAFRDLLGLANRANVSFYPIDPRGLPVFDSSMAAPLPPEADRKRLQTRIDSLRTLAADTDGVAVVNSNDLEGGVRRIGDDLTSYYLLGYYSTNTALDGRFRAIKVRVKRPGVEVRGRPGYRAATEAEVRGGTPAPDRPDAPPAAVQAALDSLGGIGPRAPFRTLAGFVPGVGFAGGATAGARAWVVTELDPATARSEELAAGARVDAVLVDAKGASPATGSAALAAGQRSVRLNFNTPLAPGEYAVRVRIRPEGGGLPYSDTARVTVPGEGATVGSPQVLRRSQATGTAYLATADLRFRRTERLRVEWPVSSSVAGPPQVDLLDRLGKPVAVPVTASERTDENGARWIVADVALAPLAPGDYALAVRAGDAADVRAAAAFRIVP